MNPTSDQLIEQFLTTLRANLGPITLPEREEIVREIAAHHRIYDIGILFPIPAPPIHEVAGFWFIPASLAVASAILILTTVVIRQFLRLSTTVQQKLDGYHPAFLTPQPSSPSR